MILRWEDRSFHTFANSDFIEITDPDYSKYKLFYKGKILFEDRGIKTYTFEDNWPLVLSKNYAYNKKTGNLIDHHSKYIYCMPYVEYYIIADSINATYYDYNDKPIAPSKIFTSSKGVRIAIDNENNFILIDKNNKPIEGMIFDDIDPFCWQSDYLAVKKNGKWGYVGSDGMQYVKCTLDYAGPVIMGHSYIEVSEDNIKAALLDITTRKYGRIGNIPLESYYFNQIDNECLFYYKMDSKDGNKYGFINLSGGGMNGITDFPNFVDGFSISSYSVGDDYRKIAFNLNANVVIRADKILKRIDKNLFLGIVSNEYKHILFNEKGETLIDLSKSKLRIEGPLNLGLIPFSSPGGSIKFNGKKHGYGYLYDNFTQSYEKTIAQYGTFGSISDAEMADKFLADRINLMDYYQILGNRALDRGDNHKAIEYFDKMIDLYVVTPTAFFGKGLAYINLEDYETALEMFERFSKMPQGTEYAKAVCYFNMGNLEAAKRCCTKIDSDDPTFDDALQMRKEIQNIRKSKSRNKTSKLDKAIAILGAISNGLQLFSQTMVATQSNQPTYSPAASSYNSSKANSSTNRRGCNSCNGSGLSSSKERAPFYSYSEETYSNHPCEICGDRDSHYHKPCPSCQGKGYTITAF